MRIVRLTAHPRPSLNHVGQHLCPPDAVICDVREGPEWARPPRIACMRGDVNQEMQQIRTEQLPRLMSPTQPKQHRSAERDR